MLPVEFDTHPDTDTDTDPGDGYLDTEKWSSGEEKLKSGNGTLEMELWKWRSGKEKL